MIDIERQKRTAIKQAKRKIGEINKRRVKGKLSPEDREELEQTQELLSRWERLTPKGIRL